MLQVLNWAGRVLSLLGYAGCWIPIQLDTHSSPNTEGHTSPYPSSVNSPPQVLTFITFPCKLVRPAVAASSQASAMGVAGVMGYTNAMSEKAYATAATMALPSLTRQTSGSAAEAAGSVGCSASTGDTGAGGGLAV